MRLFYRVVNKIGRISPDFIGRLIVKIPFKFLYGNVYNKFGSRIKKSENWSEAKLESHIINSFDKIFQHSKKFNFYRNKYKKSGVLELVVKSLEDIKKIPILTRNEIRENITDFKGYYSAKTSGTTGNPLSLYLDKNAWAREWAHYHYIWGKVGYHNTDAKFNFRERGIKDRFIKYNFQHNEYDVNTFIINNLKSYHINEFFKILTTHKIKYLRGYPSAINDFLKEIEGVISINQKEILINQIEACFYNSEYPAPQIIDYLKNKWGFDFISGYGHTEMCVLAVAKINKLNYYPLHTYGYAEVEDNMLLGTSYNNFDMPLVRYNTDDLVRPIRYANGILKSFKVKDGRIMDFIFDKKNLQISSILVIYKMENKIFNYVDYIQVFQEEKGFVTLIISQSKGVFIDAPSLMNLEVFDISFDFIYLKRPIRTLSGKVPLRVKKLP